MEETDNSSEGEKDNDEILRLRKGYMDLSSKKNREIQELKDEIDRLIIEKTPLQYHLSHIFLSKEIDIAVDVSFTMSLVLVNGEHQLDIESLKKHILKNLMEIKTK